MTIPPYREEFLGALRRGLPNLRVAAGNEFYDGSVRQRSGVQLANLPLRNRFLLHRRLAFQWGCRSALVGADVAIVELNPRTISTWLLLFEARARRRPIIVWGHYLGRNPGAQRPGIGRSLQVRLSGRVLAYTHHDADLFRQRFARVAVHVAANATESARGQKPPSGIGRDDFVYVGRLVPSKHVELLIEGFAEAVKRGMIRQSSYLVVAGDGPDREVLERLAAQSEVADRVRFVGSTYESSSLDQIYSSAIAGVSGGYVGLGIIQSLSRGVPFIYPADAPHSPEIALADPGVNAFSFAPSHPGAVAEAMQSASTMNHHCGLDFVSIQKSTLAVHSLERMVEGFVAAVSAAVGTT